jgi:protein-disulfide isomerase
MRSSQLWVVLLSLLLGPAVWAEAVVIATTSPIPPAAERSEADKAEIARLLAIARQTQSGTIDYPAEVDISGHPSIGGNHAPLAMIEFGSYQCGFCRRHFVNTLPRLQSAYVDTGKLRYVFFDLALDKRHQHAARAAEAAHCANEQGRFLAYRSALFATDDLAAEFLPRHAATAGLDSVAFASCLESARYRTRLEADRMLSRQLRVRGTPSFFIGRLHADGERVSVVRRIGGARPYATFSQQLDTLYAGVPPQGESAISVALPQEQQAPEGGATD